MTEQSITQLEKQWPIGTSLSVKHDGFEGTVQGYYITREGNPGLCLQLHNAKVVHVYGEKWFKKPLIDTKLKSKDTPE